MGQVYEIAAGQPHPATLRRAVSEVDALLPDSEHRGDRILALADVAPDAHWWESEYAFLQANPRRRGEVYQVQPGIFDVDPAQSWEVNYATYTGEVYAREEVTWSFAEAHAERLSGRHDANVPEGWTARDGALTGRCVLLGRLPTRNLVEATLNLPASVVAHRRGGLAWMYERINLSNRILRAGFSAIDGFGDYADPQAGFVRAWAYLDEVHPGEPSMLPPGLRSAARRGAEEEPNTEA
ncbi:hypothetical protein [Prescottella agglutinans]|uniref:hypothetical protein n=1 Tax=Prescottella agglutinans TaxID=1644129 RepID=UPI0024730E81|nr:hypothetical protein [Prescottella agglutinans]